MGRETSPGSGRQDPMDLLILDGQITGGSRRRCLAPVVDARVGVAPQQQIQGRCPSSLSWDGPSWVTPHAS